MAFDRVEWWRLEREYGEGVISCNSGRALIERNSMIGCVSIG